MMIQRFCLLITVVLSFTTQLTATHVVAGEITYEQIGPLTIRITITTYTNSHSAVDRESLEVEWGDGTTELIPRINGKGVLIENNIVNNVYIREHTYPRRGGYTVGMTDPHRNGGILNVNFPNSIRVTFHLSTVITVLDDIDKFPNHSPVLLQPPVDVGCIDKPYFHNPNPYDIDGDSLSFEWAVPLQSEGNPVPHFLSPDEIEPGPDNKITLNEETGDIVWQSPQKAGQYNIAIRINEYRCGQLISSIIRDMSIIILDCTDDPPEINATEKACVTAGDLLEIPILINDPNKDTQLVRFSANGGPLIQDISPAFVSSGTLFESVPRTIDFIWQTTCDHIRSDDYTVVFKATDDYFTDTSGLSNLKSLRINVSGPAPERPQLEQFTHYNKITGPDSYRCKDNPAFRGYTIWRSEGNKVIPEGSCPIDLSDYGYSKIGFSHGNSSFEFHDTSILEGLTYCYLLTARFDQTNSGTSACTSVESKVSEKICTARDTLLPLITRASVIETDPTEGVIRVDWSGPDRTNDSLTKAGSYTMTVYFSNTATGQFIPIPESTVSDLSPDQLFKKFIFIHQNINSTDAQYFYKIQLTSTHGEIGFSGMASTISLRADPQDSKVILNWHSLTPWHNYNYTIYRMNNGQWQNIGQSPSTTFIDTTVQNGKEHCYRIESFGTFPLSAIPDTTLNLSQKVCVIPRPPQSLCKPELTVHQNCESHKQSMNIKNSLSFKLPYNCLENLENLKVLYWFRTDQTDTFINITDESSLTRVSPGEAHHSGSGTLSGCYRIQTEDRIGRQSPFSDIQCVTPCSTYELPNVFSPNDDGINDYFKPVINNAIVRVNFKVFDRWGNLLYYTSDPSLEWNGKTSKGQILESGIYTYICDLFIDEENDEKHFDTISGSIGLIR